MSEQKDWALKGTYYECCRIEGQCPLWFGRDLWDKPCTNLATYEIEKGRIGDVDVSGITFMLRGGEIGPKWSDLAKGIGEGAGYVSDNATAEQRKVLEPFILKQFGAGWKKNRGIKFVKIEISKAGRVRHIVMPFGEQKFVLTVGGDGETPMRLENVHNPSLSNIRLCNTEVWKYHDYGHDLEFHNTSGEIADFDMRGSL
ncbi:MAG: hypothetical protein A2Y73_02165 [Chloroflexi bacterium RBG_13_56_8]|nr:MAG: hypothetical protein A2Y73_02165 [Chloroflexi bacterium RBG_13_56_8]